MTTPASVLDLPLTSLEGHALDPEVYRGQVVLLVNVASDCGLTPQYAALGTLYRQYKGRGLRILAFPCNDFGGQEPGTPDQIRQFCTTRFAVDFDLMAKVTVKGPDRHPVYAFLTGAATNPAFAGDIEWNFAKFLLDRQGRVVGRFHPQVEPLAPEIVDRIEQLLADGKSLTAPR